MISDHAHRLYSVGDSSDPSLGPCYSVQHRLQSLWLHCLLSPNDKPTWCFTKMDNWKRNWPTKIKVKQRKKRDSRKVKFESHIVIRDSSSWECWKTASWENVNMQPYLVMKATLTTEMRKVIAAEKDEDPEELRLAKKFHVKGTLRGISPRWSFKG